MNILISNDDGIKAKGIARLTEALQGKGDIYVFAPDRQRSASSHALTLHAALAATEVDFDGAKRAWEVSGTPADCVKLGIHVLREMGVNVDIVYAGINHGPNLGTDTMYSGTVSAAAEGIFDGIPSVAVSVCDHDPKNFDAACKLARDVFDQALETAHEQRVISINTPDLPMEQIKGVRIAKLGTVIYDEWFEIQEERKPDTALYKYASLRIDDRGNEADMDTELIRNGYATISTVRYNLRDDQGLEILKKWELTL